MPIEGLRRYIQAKAFTRNGMVNGRIAINRSKRFPGTSVLTVIHAYTAPSKVDTSAAPKAIINVFIRSVVVLGEVKTCKKLLKVRV